MEMKRSLGLITIALSLGFLAASVYAQPAGGGGGRGGFMGGRISDTVSDLLVLDKAQAEKVTTALEKVQASQREKFQAAMQGGQNMSQEERRAAMEKVSTEISGEAKTALKGILSDDQLKLVDPYLGSMRFRGNAEMRALRQLDLKPEQRTQLQKETLAYAKAVQELRTPGAPPAADMREKMQSLQKDFSDKAGKVLTADQAKDWKTKTEEVQKAMEQERQQRPARNQ
jgi:hypothetical protein